MDIIFQQALDSILNGNYNIGIQNGNTEGGRATMYENLRAIRNKAHIPAKEMADLLGLKTEAAYYKKENGAIRISIEEAKLIADKLDMPIEDIFFSNEVSVMETDGLANKPTCTGCIMEGR